MNACAIIALVLFGGMGVMLIIVYTIAIVFGGRD